MDKHNDWSWDLSAAEVRRGLHRPDALGASCMVASAHPAAVSAGLSILQRGGNAFDAAVAIAAAEGVLLPMMCGLGADAFVVLHDARKHETVAMNGSGVAAAGATREYYASRGHTLMPAEGVHSVSVPGAVSVYEELWKRYCTLPWPELWEPAIRLAREGVAITQFVGEQFAARAEALARHPTSAEQFLPGGRPPAVGERWAAPKLALTLEAVARGGADAYYRGQIAEDLLRFLKHEGALFVPEDFASQRAVVYEPLATQYRGLTVYETAPPSQGFLVLEQLNIIEGYDLRALAPDSAERMHLLVEAKKLAFADRNRYAGDPAYVEWPVKQLISKEHAAKRRAQIDPRQARFPDVRALPEHNGDTSYFAVADREGNAVSFIHSLSNAFGSAVVAGDTGVLLNNRAGRGFSFDPTHPNVIGPGRRTMHTLNAYLVCRDGRPWLIGGTPGGDQQTQWSTQIISNVVDHTMTLQEAVDAPRWYSFPGTDPVELGASPVVRVERGVPEAAIKALAKLGHTVQTIPPWSGTGATQLIQFDYERGVLRGGSDLRRGGIALGY